MFNGSPLILVTCGVTFALLVGVIDLSVGAIGYASGCLAGILIKSVGIPLIPAFLAGIALGVAIGYINSLFIVKLKMNPMLVSMGMMLIIRAIGKIITQDRTISLGLSVSPLRQAKIAWLGKFPVLLFVVFAIVLICALTLRYNYFFIKLL
jgi:ribose transport system permease protein